MRLPEIVASKPGRELRGVVVSVQQFIDQRDQHFATPLSRCRLPHAGLGSFGAINGAPFVTVLPRNRYAD